MQRLARNTNVELHVIIARKTVNHEPVVCTNAKGQHMASLVFIMETGTMSLAQLNVLLLASIENQNFCTRFITTISSQKVRIKACVSTCSTAQHLEVCICY